MDLLDKQIKDFLEKETSALSKPVNSRWVPGVEDFYEFITDKIGRASCRERVCQYV